MKCVILVAAAAAALSAQQAPTQQPVAGAPGQTHEMSGDDIRGYSDTPQLPNQKWKVHDMERPRPVKVTPGPYVNEVPPADAICSMAGTSRSGCKLCAGAGRKSRNGKSRTAISRSFRVQ